VVQDRESTSSIAPTTPIRELNLARRSAMSIEAFGVSHLFAIDAPLPKLMMFKSCSHSQHLSPSALQILLDKEDINDVLVLRLGSTIADLSFFMFSHLRRQWSYCLACVVKL
jgi:hypothetical protein